MGAPRRRPRLALLLGAGMALLLLEVLLQSWAYLQWSARTRKQAPEAATRTILCIGDSFTYGIGAGDAHGPYPAQLEKMLRAEGHGDVRIANEGWPGRTSAAVLQRVAAHVKQHRPEWVYVLVGYNDRWASADEVLETDPDFDTEAFSVEWRTGRFVKLAVHALLHMGGDPGSKTVAPRPFLGVWHHRTLGGELIIRADGTLVMDGKLMTWTREGSVLWLRAPELPIYHRGFPLTWNIVEGGSLSLASERWVHVYNPGEAPPGRSRLAAAQTALKGKRYEEAAAGFRACLDDPELELPARSGLVQVLVQSNPEEAAQHLSALRRLHDEGGGPEHASALAHGLAASGLPDEAFELVCQYLERYGHGTGLLHLLVPAGAAPSPEQTARAVRALRAATEVKSDALPGHRAAVWRALAAALIGEDPAEAIRCLMQATALDGIRGELAQTIAQNAKVVTREVYDGLLGRVTADAKSRALLQSTASAVFGDGRGPDSMLERHLRRIIEYCRGAGVDVVLLDYPRPFAEVEGALQRLHDLTGTDYLRVRPTFDRALQSRAFDELFDQDQLHPNDAGYAIMAKRIAEDALARLRR